MKVLKRVIAIIVVSGDSFGGDFGIGFPKHVSTH